MIDYKSKTKQESLDWANAITWENSYSDVMKRLYPYSILEIGNVEGKSSQLLYDELMPYQMIGHEKVYNTKLPWSDVLSESNDYKSDMLQAVDRTYRLVDMWGWNLVNDGLQLFPGVKDFDSLLSQVLDEPDTIKLEQMEAESIISKDNYDFINGMAERKRKMSVGLNCIAAVNYLNDKNSITSGQTAAQLGDPDIQQIMTALQAGSLEMAKSLIQAKDLNGLEPMDQSYKDKIIGLIDEYLGA